jgi:hypothetical protein
MYFFIVPDYYRVTGNDHHVPEMGVITMNRNGNDHHESLWSASGFS